MGNRDFGPNKPLVEGEKLVYPLAPLTSWHVGGTAERFYRPSNVKDLKHYLSLFPHDVPWTWLGLGSNVLIRDKGVFGLVICTRQLQQLQEEEGSIIAQAGVTCAKLARFCCKLGFADAAFFAGIPGTVGGALAMNAGAFGGQTWDWVQTVYTINRQGECIRRTPNDYEIGYRQVISKEIKEKQEAFVGAVFRFPMKKESDGMGKIRELLQKRSATQPIGTFNCGSVYRNPPGQFAAKLIEECQLKGMRVGDAMVSPKHANFIVNCNKAKAKDIETLMAIIEEKVLTTWGVSLQAEVRILGEN